MGVSRLHTCPRDETLEPWTRDAARSAWQGNRGSNRSMAFSLPIARCPRMCYVVCWIQCALRQTGQRERACESVLCMYIRTMPHTAGQGTTADACAWVNLRHARPPALVLIYLSLERPWAMARIRPPSSTINVLQLCRAYSPAGASELGRIGRTAHVACSLPPWWWQRLNIPTTYMLRTQYNCKARNDRQSATSQAKRRKKTTSI
jgi:hypothetical protein